MVPVVEKCYLDLQKVNLEGEMNSVSMTEKLLPRIQKCEWIMTADKISNSEELFPELLKFLQCEKRVIEYSESSVRSMRAENSTVCHVTGPEGAGESQLYGMVKKLQEGQITTNRMLEETRTQFVGNTLNVNRKTSKRCWIHDSDGHDINECGKFRSLNSLERLEMSKKRGICFRCLGERHVSRICRSGLVCDVKDEGGNICGKNHHPLLHGSFSDDNVTANSGNCKCDKAMSSVSTTYSMDQPINVLWDSGSDITLITHGMAKKLGVKGADVMMFMVKVGNVTENVSAKNICVQDNAGNNYELKATGMDDISAQGPVVELSQVSTIFPDVNIGVIARPSGKVDMLIGTDYCELLPQVIRTKGKLQLLKNCFG